MKISLIHSADEWRKSLGDFDTFESYHTWDFHQIELPGAGHRSLAIEVKSSGNALFIPFIERLIPRTCLRDMTSVYGYPGPVFKGDLSQFPLLLASALDELKRLGYVSVFSRCSSFSMEATEDLPSGFQLAGRTVYIDLSTPLSEQWNGYRGNLRRDINKATETGVQCMRDGAEAVPAFLSLYHSTMDKVQASQNYYFDESYVLSLMGARDFDCRLYTCRYDGKIIAAALFMFCNDIVQYHLSGSDADYAKLGATKLLIDTVRRIATDEGRRYLNLGGGLGGQLDRLYEFKLGFSKSQNDFYLFKSVLNQDAYDDLCFAAGLGHDVSSNYFPKYRKPAANGDLEKNTAK